MAEGLELDIDWKRLATFAAILGAGCALLFVLFYLQHPDASLLDTFGRRGPRVPPSEDVKAAMDAEESAKKHE